MDDTVDTIGYLGLRDETKPAMSDGPPTSNPNFPPPDFSSPQAFGQRDETKPAMSSSGPPTSNPDFPAPDFSAPQAFDRFLSLLQAPMYSTVPQEYAPGPNPSPYYPHPGYTQQFRPQTVYGPANVPAPTGIPPFIPQRYEPPNHTPQLPSHSESESSDHSDSTSVTPDPCLTAIRTRQRKSEQQSPCAAQPGTPDKDGPPRTELNAIADEFEPPNWRNQESSENSLTMNSEPASELISSASRNKDISAEQLKSYWRAIHVAKGDWETMETRRLYWKESARLERILTRNGFLGP